MQTESYEGGWSDEDDGYDPSGYQEPSPAHDQPSLFRQQSYRSMDVQGIAARQTELAQEISEVFGVSPDEAFALLVHLNWQHEKLNEIWFDEKKQRKLREDAGIGKGGEFRLDQIKLPPDCQYCIICCEPATEAFAIKQCGDAFCILCWSGYLRTKIEGGPSTSEVIGCMNSACSLKIPITMTRWLLSHLKERPVKKGTKQRIPTHELAGLYEKYLAMGFTNLNKFVRWCPRAGCGFATETMSGNLATTVTCKCGQVFCLKCGLEQHNPVRCETAQKWNQKNQNESQNTTWILANTKPCPKCKKPIEKNQGCNHMNCKCGASYCWVCLEDWGKHGSETGGYYKCNKYEGDESRNAEEAKRQSAQDELNKYMFYYERYANHQRAQRHVLGLTDKIQLNLEQLNHQRHISFNEMEFFHKAIEIVGRSRVILKWSYAYGYYLKEATERNLLEYLQQKLEENADLLHELLERPFIDFYREDDPKNQEFYKHKQKLTNLSMVTENFYRNFMEGIKVGLTTGGG